MHHRVLNEDAGQLEFKMEVTPDDPDGQAEVTLAIVSMWDSAGVDRIAMRYSISWLVMIFLKRNCY